MSALPKHTFLGTWQVVNGAMSTNVHVPKSNARAASPADTHISARCTDIVRPSRAPAATKSLHASDGSAAESRKSVSVVDQQRTQCYTDVSVVSKVHTCS